MGVHPRSSRVWGGGLAPGVRSAACGRGLGEPLPQCGVCVRGEVGVSPGILGEGYHGGAKGPPTLSWDPPPAPLCLVPHPSSPFTRIAFVPAGSGGGGPNLGMGWGQSRGGGGSFVTWFCALLKREAAGNARLRWGGGGTPMRGPRPPVPARLLIHGSEGVGQNVPRLGGGVIITVNLCENHPKRGAPSSPASGLKLLPRAGGRR